MKIQICKKFSKVNTLQAKLTNAFPDDVIVIKKCLSMCKACKTQPVTKAAGKKLTAKSISKIIAKIENL